MRKIGRLLLTLVVAALTGDASWAHGGKHCDECLKERQGKSIERHLGKMTRRLDLSADQRASVRKILEEKWEAKRAILKESAEKLDALRKDTGRKIGDVLTPEQRAKHEEGKSKRADKTCRRHGGREGHR